MLNKIKYYPFVIISFSLFMFSQLLAQDSSRLIDNETEKVFVQARDKYYSGDTKTSGSLIKEFLEKVFKDPKKYPFDDWAESSYQFARELISDYQDEFLSLVFEPLMDNEPYVINNDYYNQLGSIVSYIALAYKRMGLTSASLPIYLKALDYFKLCNSLPQILMASIYINIGNAMSELGDLSLADNYYQEASRVINNKLEDNSIDNQTINRYISLKVNLLNNMGLNYQGLGKHRQALQTFSQAKILAEKHYRNYLPRLHNNLGVSFQALDSLGKAADNYLEAIDSYKNIEKDESWIRYSLNYSDLIINSGIKDIGRAKDLLEEVIGKIDSIPGLSPEKISTAFYQKGMIYIRDNEYKNAVKSYDKGIGILAGEPGITDSIPEIPEVSLDNFPNQVILGIKFRARLYNDWGDYLGADTLKYILSLKNYELAEQCIDSLRSILQAEESKINLSRLAKETYSEKIDLLWKLYDLTGDNSLVNKAFETMEKGKASAIWNLIQLSETKTSSLPQDIINEESSLQENIAYYHNQIIILENTGSFEAALMDSLKRTLFAYESRLDSLRNYININFRDYGEKKYSSEVYDIDEIRGLLNRGQVMIQYYFSEYWVHELMINHDTIIYRVIDEPDSVRKSIESFMSMLNLDHFSYSDNDVVEYNYASWGIYELLIKPFDKYLKNKKLIILPDDYLSLIPFEALVYSEKINPGDDFRDLNYLLTKNDISYAFNASLWAYTKENTEPARKNILGFAPAYDVKEMDTSNVWRKWRNSLPELPGTYEEVKLLRKKYGAKTFSKKRSTEKRFKEHAEGYKILHLAMHTLMDEGSPENSFFVFTPLADKEEDGKLFANEISSFRLNSALTVLSACNSGTGELAAGEGILSLSRMFILGGSSSVIMTLWSVDDRASKELINKFYQNLSFDMTISEALRSSKSDFIINSGKLQAHPYFWAGFIQLGKDDRIELEERNLKLPYLISGLVILALIVFFLFFKNTKSRP